VISKPQIPADLAKRGKLRIKDEFFKTHGVEVEFGRFGTIIVPEDHYIDQGYEPDLDQLPWKEVASSRKW
jgi:hypothetical protein